MENHLGCVGGFAITVDVAATPPCCDARRRIKRFTVECFVDYALAQPDVRLVTFKDVVEWMRKPKAIH